jgi:hypothetical protein
MAPEDAQTDRSWIGAWDQLSSQQDRLSRELLLTWIIVGLVCGAAILFLGGKAIGGVS